MHCQTKSTVTFVTGATLTIPSGDGPYAASSYYPSTTSVMVMYPEPPSDGTKLTCQTSSSSGRKLSATQHFPTYKHVKFDAVYTVAKPQYLKVLMPMLVNSGADKVSIRKKNPWLAYYTYRHKRIPAGKKIYCTFDRKAFVYKTKRAD